MEVNLRKWLVIGVTAVTLLTMVRNVMFLEVVGGKWLVGFVWCLSGQ